MIQKLCAWVLGGWLFLSISMAYVAGSTFATLKPDQLRRANEVFATLEANSERPLALRYVASELNRRFFRHYGILQALVGAIAVLLIFKTQNRWALVLILAAFGLALFFHFYLIPHATELGREIDFVPRVPVTEAREKFDKLHKMSTTTEGIKMLLIIIASVLTIRHQSHDLAAPRS